MDDLLFTMKRESHALQELRKDIQAIWVDAVARELNGRYLNPHEGDDQQMLAALNRQKDALDQARIKLDSAQTCARQAENHVAEVIDNLQSAEQELENVRNNYETYAHYHATARSNVPTVQSLIRQANSACDDKQQPTETPLSRLPKRSGPRDKTTGILVINGQEYGPVVSGVSGPAKNMPKGSPGFTGVLRSHVEAHSAALMRERRTMNATLYINNPPCRFRNGGCDAMLPRMLPNGASLRVVGPRGFDKTYHGVSG